jgi:hypothetical protein
MPDRTLAIPAQAGSTAQTTIPDNPAPGTAYRNESLAAGTINQGWPYDTVVDSADQNQLMYLITGLLRLIEQTGILPWCATVAYPSAGVLCLGSDNKIYIALQASTNKQPTTETAYWQLLSTHINPTFGLWSIKSDGVTYKADTDGFVVAKTDGVSIHGLTSLNPGDNPPIRDMGTNRSVDSSDGQIMFPVRKNDYWLVVNNGGTAFVQWLPFGT